MQQFRTYSRWVYCELERLPGEPSLQPVVREYIGQHNRWVAPLFQQTHTHTLVHCRFLHNEIEAAEKDPRLVILGSLHGKEAIPEAVASGLRDFGVTSSMNVHDMLMQMAISTGTRQFLPEH